MGQHMVELQKRLTTEFAKHLEGKVGAKPAVKPSVVRKSTNPALIGELNAALADRHAVASQGGTGSGAQMAAGSARESMPSLAKIETMNESQRSVALSKLFFFFLPESEAEIGPFMERFEALAATGDPRHRVLRVDNALRAWLQARCRNDTDAGDKARALVSKCDAYTEAVDGKLAKAKKSGGLHLKSYGAQAAGVAAAAFLDEMAEAQRLRNSRALVEFLMQAAPTVEGPFRVPGLVSVVNAVEADWNADKALDFASIPKFGVNEAAMLFKRVFRGALSAPELLNSQKDGVNRSGAEAVLKTMSEFDATRARGALELAACVAQNSAITQMGLSNQAILSNTLTDRPEASASILDGVFRAESAGVSPQVLFCRLVVAFEACGAGQRSVLRPQLAAVDPAYQS